MIKIAVTTYKSDTYGNPQRNGEVNSKLKDNSKAIPTVKYFVVVQYSMAKLKCKLIFPFCSFNPKTSTNHFFQRLSLMLQKGNAALILSRSTDIHYPDITGLY